MHEENSTATRMMGFVVLAAHIVFLVHAGLRIFGVNFGRFHG